MENEKFGGCRLVEIPVENLVLPEAGYQREQHYIQRERTTARARRMLRDRGGLDWPAFGALMVHPTRRKGMFGVTDGEHRLEMARLEGVDTVPCWVAPAASLAEEIGRFETAQNRKAVTPVKLFHNDVLRGSEPAVLLQELVSEFGLRVQQGVWPNIGCIAELRRAQRLHGLQPIRMSLECITEAWDGLTDGLRIGPLGGMCFFFGEYVMARQFRIDIRHFICQLERNTPVRIAQMTDPHRPGGGGRRSEWARAYRVLYNRNKRGNGRIPPPRTDGDDGDCA